MDTKQTKPGLIGRRRNLQAALQHVYREGVTTRASIARLTGVTRATASELVSQLVQDRLVREVGPGASSGGKPPTLLELNETGREILAIDLSQRPFRGALVDLSGTIRRRTGGRSERVRGREGLREVFRLVDSLVEEAAAPILGVGVGTPGIVDDSGAVIEASNLEWHGVPLQRELMDRVRLPVKVANDAHVGALAEFGSHPGDNVVLVKVGFGIGAGIVVDGSLYRGDRPAAGEIGHIRVVDGGKRCRCGNTGCLETVASVPSILRAAAERGGLDAPPARSLPWVVDDLAPLLGPENLHAATAEAGARLGAVLAHLVAILDIHRIVIALELRGGEDTFLESVRAVVVDRVLPDLASVVDFSTSTTGTDLVLAGAAALVLRDQLGVVWQ
jgi:predicted NBD/HSP70 family sugar kinase